MTKKPGGDRREKPGPVRLMKYLTGNDPGLPPIHSNSRPLIGVIEGTGIGPQVVRAALEVLKSVEKALDLKFEVRYGGMIGEEAVAHSGRWLPENTVEFCAEIFHGGGAILSGPGGGRYVYDLRRRFDLFCKFVPVRPAPELARAGKLAPQYLKDVDLLIVRDNTGGVYQGRMGRPRHGQGPRRRTFLQLQRSEVHRLIEVAARAAAGRRGRLHVIVKEGGVPTMTRALARRWRRRRQTARHQGGVHERRPCRL